MVDRDEYPWEELDLTSADPAKMVKANQSKVDLTPLKE